MSRDYCADELTIIEDYKREWERAEKFIEVMNELRGEMKARKKHVINRGIDLGQPTMISNISFINKYGPSFLSLPIHRKVFETENDTRSIERWKTRRYGTRRLNRVGDYYWRLLMTPLDLLSEISLYSSTFRLDYKRSLLEFVFPELCRNRGSGPIVSDLLERLNYIFKEEDGCECRFVHIDVSKLREEDLIKLFSFMTTRG